MDQFDDLLELVGRPQLFATGELHISERAEANLRTSDVFTGLNRHIGGEWNDLEEWEKESLLYAVEQYQPILSVHTVCCTTLFFIFTNAHRNRTDVWLIDEDLPHFNH